MALTDIARQLKKTFNGFDSTGLQDYVDKFRKTYGDAEPIRIGEIDYIVINGEYSNEEYSDLPNGISPLFCNLTDTIYSIIDAKTSAILIDEVYSRVTYMRKDFSVAGDENSLATVSPQDVEKSFKDLKGAETTLKVNIPKETVSGSANIFQCQLIKDTGVSASSDTYSFMLQNGEIKELDENVMQQIRGDDAGDDEAFGKVSFLMDREAVKRNNEEIQKAVFKKFQDSDIEIQSVSVKSIYEIALSFANVVLEFEDKKTGKFAMYHTMYLPSRYNEFDALNSSIHTCNSCKHDLVDVEDGRKHKMHINTDALYYNGEMTPTYRNKQPVYAMGCEECLVQCPVCGEWHFDYSKFVGSKYDKVLFAHGRQFIKNLKNTDANYCSCRRGIEWIYDEKTGEADNQEHDIIPIQKMAFVNYADERIASYADWIDFYGKNKKRGLTGADEANDAAALLKKFRKRLALKYELSPNDITITSIDKCGQCSVCGGDYYGVATFDDQDYCCPICEEMIAEKKHMLTRVDGVIFLRKQVKSHDVICKYVMTKLGNLRQLSTREIVTNDGVDEDLLTDESNA